MFFRYNNKDIDEALREFSGFAVNPRAKIGRTLLPSDTFSATDWIASYPIEMLPPEYSKQDEIFPFIVILVQYNTIFDTEPAQVHQTVLMTDISRSRSARFAGNLLKRSEAPFAFGTIELSEPFTGSGRAS